MKKIFLYFDQKFKKEYLKKTVYEQNDQEKKNIDYIGKLRKVHKVTIFSWKICDEQNEFIHFINQFKLVQIHSKICFITFLKIKLYKNVQIYKKETEKYSNKKTKAALHTPLEKLQTLL